MPKTVAEKHKAAVAKLASGFNQQIYDAWMRAYGNLLPQIIDFLDSVAEQRKEGAIITRQTLAGYAKWQSLQAQITEEFARMAAVADGATTSGQRQLVQLASKHAMYSVLSQLPKEINQGALKKMGMPWQNADVTANSIFVGKMTDGTQVRTTFQEITSGIAINLMTTLLDSAIKGTPKNMASVSAYQNFMQGMHRSLHVADTEQWNVYRFALMSEAKSNPHLVRGFRHTAELDPKTCIGCVAMHGREYGIDQQKIPTHPQDKCYPQPIANIEKFGLQPEAQPTGTEWFESLSQEAKQIMLGPTRYEAYSKNGKKLEDFVIIGNHERWGEVLAVAPANQSTGIEDRQG